MRWAEEITSPDSPRGEKKRGRTWKRRQENRRVTPAAVDSATQPKLLTLKWESLQSDFISPQQTCDWTGVKVEDELISRWHTERMDRLHTAEWEPFTLHVWSDCEVKCVDDDDYRFHDCPQSSTCFIVWKGGTVCGGVNALHIWRWPVNQTMSTTFLLM